METRSFQNVVMDSCRELVRDCGFNFRRGDESFVSFESDDVVISFAYDRIRAYELNIGIALKSQQDAGIIPFNLGEVMREFNVRRADECSYLQSSSLDRISEFVSSVCDTLLEDCMPILKGDRAAFEKLLTRRAFEASQYTIKIRLDSIRKEVEEAWRTKDYAKYRALLTGFESVLTESEKKKLDFASKK